MDENRVDERREWLEPDGRGGFASGTVAGTRTRRYHALLLAEDPTVSRRYLLVNGFDAWIETAEGRFALHAQRYAPDVLHPSVASGITAFTTRPWPQWRLRADDSVAIEHDIFVQKGRGVTALSWKVDPPREPATLRLRPLLSGRDPSALHFANPVFRFDAMIGDGRVAWRPYDGVPGILLVHNGGYEHNPDWYRNFLYIEDRARGLDHIEDLASPGELRFDLSAGPAIVLLAPLFDDADPPIDHEAEAWLRSARSAEKRRRTRFRTREERSADAYVVRNDDKPALVSSYPPGTANPRETLIALRGICLAGARWAEAAAILLDLQPGPDGLLRSNRDPGHGVFASVDAPLWWIIAAHELAQAVGNDRRRLRARDRVALENRIGETVRAFADGTAFGIHADRDGLLAAGEPGTALTWMAESAEGRALNPRVGKPVEVQALWLNALRIAGAQNSEWMELYERGRAAFEARFVDSATGALYDVVDADHESGRVDRTFRANQIFAVGGLPYAVLDGAAAKTMVEAVEARLLTPFGLRTLAPDQPGYHPRVEGGLREREAARHNGAAWTWLLGPFLEAWIRVRGGTAPARDQARERFIEPALQLLDSAGLDHLPEMTDPEPPFKPRGAPFHACALGELLRLGAAGLAP